MKTPEEIKKGLECCAVTDCRNCPYESDPYCVVKNKDALAYIQQLEARNAELVKKMEQLEWERDAAVMDIHKTCSTCKHYYYNRQDDDAADCLWFNGCKIDDHWEWCGAPEKEAAE